MRLSEVVKDAAVPEGPGAADIAADSRTDKPAAPTVYAGHLLVSRVSPFPSAVATS
jgi:hypothetical protein